MAGIYYKARHQSQYKPKRLREQSLPYTSVFFLIIVAFLCLQSHFNTQKQSNQLDNSFLHSTVRASGGYGNLCSGNNVFSSRFSLFFLIPGILFTFFGLAILTDEYFVAALEKICERLDLSEDVAGATFMAAGSSAPEFFISLVGVFYSADEVGLGTIVGSAVFNILVIIGLSAALAGTTLDLDWRPLARDSFFYIVSIAMLLIFILPVTKGVVDWWEGLILVGCYAIYVLFMAFGNKSYMRFTKRFLSQSRQAGDIETGNQNTQDIDQITSEDTEQVQQPPLAEKRNYSELTPRAKLRPASRFRAAQYAVIAAHRLASSSSSEGSDERNTERVARMKLLGIEVPSTVMGWIFFPFSFIWRVIFKYTIINCAEERWAHLWPITFLASIIWICAISFVMVEATRIVGCLIGIPSAVMGLTVLAAGTSVPDALASIAVARNGAGDMAVSNAIGSNVFDILLGLGFPWFIAGLAKQKSFKVTVSPITAIVIPIIILFVIIICLVGILILMKWRLSPRLGYLLFALYGLFLLYALLDVFVFKFGG